MAHDAQRKAGAGPHPGEHRSKFDVNGVALWSSGIGGTNAERLNLEDDGRIIIYKSAWNSGTSTGQFNWTPLAHPGCDVGIGTGTTGILGPGQCFVSPNGHFELLLQADGNLVIYDLGAAPPRLLWGAGTNVTAVDPSVAMRTLYTYDTLGNLTCVEQHGNAASGTGCSASPSSDASSPWRVRRFTYDSLSRLLTAKNPESGTISYAYDNNGNLLQKTSPAPNQTGAATQTISYCYDALNRVTGKAYGTQSCPLTSPVVTYFYDAGTEGVGRLTSLTDQAGSGSYTYNLMGRMATETRTLIGANSASINKNMSYVYDLAGSVMSLTYPSGAIVKYVADGGGHALQAHDDGNGINYVSGATYGASGSLTGFVSGHSGTFAGIANAFSYNKRLQPVAMSATAPSQTVFSLGYDFHMGTGDNGNVFGITNNKDTTRSQTFTYDPLNRLASAQNAGTDCTVNVLGNNKKFWGDTYGYDAWGNLTNKTKIPTACAGENLGINVDATNRLLSGYFYDAAGNMTYDATSGLNYTFDQENRITGTNGYTYTYDGDGNRVRKSNGNAAGNGTLYWYMAPGVVAETDLAGALKSEYVFFDGERVARKDFPGNAVAYYFSDHLKTASVITDSTGNITNESDYYAWGGELQFVNSDSNDYKFTGKKRDAESGLDNFGLRYMASSLGRFTSPDPGQAAGFDHMDDPQSWNGYAYARNNPLKFIDPDGDNYHVCDEHGQNCSDQSDADFDKNKQNAQSSGEVWKNGQIYVPDENGNLQFKGTYNQTDVDLNPNAQSIVNSPVLQTAAATMTDARTYAIWTGASAIGGLALYGAGAFEGGLTTLEIGAETGAEVTPTAGQTAQISRQLAQQGKKSLRKSLRTLERRLAEHQAKLGQIKDAGGHASSVERETENFKGLIQAIKTTLGQ